MSHYEIEEDAVEAMVQFAAANSNPIVMVNLLSFRDVAIYPPDFDAEPCSGRAAMKRYQDGSENVRRIAGARTIWGGAVAQMAIAPGDEDWDMVALLEYPSATAYLTMRATSEYQAARLHRRAALRDSRLLMSVAWS
ncbi:MAG: DUF1330 domain-containing protein [Pseudomonadota bacterium]